MHDSGHVTIVLSEIFIFGGFAAMGGILAYLLRTLDEGGGPKAWRALVEALSSGFIGLIAMLACDALGVDWRWSGVVVGVFGWLGAEASIVFVIRIVKSKLGLRSDDR
jgi:hypothetical protein